ncbi:hypothetical protein M427DRAFT_309956 [Gonapodya prolifera JEL478]|uniref:Uncharacterized protein n=1 Tax=Gonapodya prolifera (strain JEL478) TaxID=1344416 RepID=A0A139AGI4_GONPJ|nr:hypothetical protein M427DRAFT_309956 [Gonapodya prolifera JEL478]|eukprot:KXS15858.1 hypothetical protein M427DRAFT_309956 [Gonapodya prolifera JEL478]
MTTRDPFTLRDASGRAVSILNPPDTTITGEATHTGEPITEHNGRRWHNGGTIKGLTLPESLLGGSCSPLTRHLLWVPTRRDSISQPVPTR